MEIYNFYEAVKSSMMLTDNMGIVLASGKRTKESLFRAFETGDRSLLGKTMAAKGLLLVTVNYDTNTIEK